MVVFSIWTTVGPVFGVLGVLLTIFTVLALAWAVSRTQGLSAWRSAAEGYKEQVNELTGRLERAEGEIEELHAKIATLEQRPDMSAAVAATARASAEVVRATKEMLAPIKRDVDVIRKAVEA